MSKTAYINGLFINYQEFVPPSGPGIGWKPHKQAELLIVKPQFEDEDGVYPAQTIRIWGYAVKEFVNFIKEASNE